VTGTCPDRATAPSVATAWPSPPDPEVHAFTAMHPPPVRRSTVRLTIPPEAAKVRAAGYVARPGGIRESGKAPFRLAAGREMPPGGRRSGGTYPGNAEI
ncbi:MAG: hypothetical protein N3A38_16335, partial [Planctomycetota bacterium]|nr:hypothetical protein [Planctomycetota bacterium]